MPDIQSVVSEILNNPQFTASIQAACTSASSTLRTSAITPNLSSNSSNVPVSRGTTSRTNSINEEIRLLFPSVHNIANNNIRNRNSRNSNKKQTKKSVYDSFCKDVILLNSPTCEKTLTGLAKIEAYKKGLYK